MTRPSILENSPTLWVTRIPSLAMTVAAISMSLPPIGVPAVFRSCLIFPYWLTTFFVKRDDDEVRDEPFVERLILLVIGAVCCSVFQFCNDNRWDAYVG